MTLCVGWIRNAPGYDGQELVFATDSRLGGGEAWDTGTKLFDLGRKDCLLCFAGDTNRTYPLILQGGLSSKFDSRWSDPRMDLTDVVDSLNQLFTRLCLSINVKGRSVTPDREEIVGKFEFLFGGWSWREERYKMWVLKYFPPPLDAFSAAEVDNSNPARTFQFIGDDVEEAKTKLYSAMARPKSLVRGLLDMEPLTVVANIARDDTDHPTIGGSLQIAKVYRSGQSEYFGVVWPSVVNGERHFLGRPINPYDAPPVRFLDPDSGGDVDLLPTRFSDLDDYEFGAEKGFVEKCYAGAGKTLMGDIPDSRKMRLKHILRENAYERFLQQRSDAEAEYLLSSEESADGATNEGEPAEGGE